jgi:hypothetical protein
MEHLASVRHVAGSISSLSEQRAQRMVAFAMIRMVGIELHLGHGNGGQAEWREVRAAASLGRPQRSNHSAEARTVVIPHP